MVLWRKFALRNVKRFRGENIGKGGTESADLLRLLE